MNIDQIIKVAEYQHDNIVEFEGNITNAEITKDTKRVVLGDMEFKLSNFAMEELINYFGLNGTYSDFEKDLGFFNSALGRKLETRKQKYGIRVMYDLNTNVAHGIKTTRYQRIYNIDLVNIVQSMGFETDEKSSFISDEYMILNILDKDKSTLKVGDFLHGVNVLNSEVGYMSLGVNSFLQRLQCTNGMVSTLLANRSKHAHIYKDLENRFKESLYMVLEDREIIRAIEKSAEREVFFDDNQTMADFLKKFRIPTVHHEPIFKQMEQEWLGNNYFNVYNGITRYATHEVESAIVQQQLLAQAQAILY